MKLSSLFFLAAVCYGAPAFSNESTPKYVSAAQYYADDTFHNGAPAFDFYRAFRGLNAQFDFICGDIYCEGEFSNLTSLDLECGINAVTGDVASCVWTFAGSYTDVNPTTGQLSVTSAVKTCELGFKGDARKLARFLGQASRPGKGRIEGIREVKIPGSEKTLMETLSDCI